MAYTTHSTAVRGDDWGYGVPNSGFTKGEDDYWFGRGQREHADRGIRGWSDHGQWQSQRSQWGTTHSDLKDFTKALGHGGRGLDDKKRDWKTSWYQSGGGNTWDDLIWTGDFAGKGQGIGELSNAKQGNFLREAIDLDAYGADALYSGALKKIRGDDYGGFTNVQDILDAESYMTGSWEPPEEPTAEPGIPLEPAWDHEAFESQYASDIESLKEELSSFNAGKVADLDTTLADMRSDIMSHVGSSYEGKLEDFKSSDWLTNYIDKKGFASAEDMAASGDATQQQIAALKHTLTGDITGQGADISGLQSDLSGVQGDVSQLTEDWSGVSSDVGVLKDQLSGYQDQLSGLDDTFSQGLTDVEGKLTSQFTDQIGDLAADNKSWQDSWQAEQDTYSTQVQDKFDALQADTDSDIASVRGDLGRDLGQAQIDLRSEFGSDIAGVRDDLGQTEQDIRTDIGSDIAGVREEFGSDIAGVESLVEGQGEDITQLGKDLFNTASGLQSSIDTSSEELHNRLTKLSSSMDYRMLGDSAMGVRMRKSRARKEGNTRQGTGQFNRSMQISALNL